MLLLIWAAYSLLFFGSRPAIDAVLLEKPEAPHQYVVQTPTGLQVVNSPTVPGKTSELPWAPLSALFWPLGMIAIYLGCGINAVDQWNRRPVTFFGKYTGTVGPGFAFVDPLLHRTIGDVNVSDCVVEHSVPKIQSHDNVPVAFVLVITSRRDESRVRDSVVNVWGVRDAMLKRAIAACAACVSNTELDEILHDHGSLSGKITDALQKMVKDWGITILSVELRDISIADEMISEAIAMKARASKEGDAEIVRAEKQHQVAVELSSAASAMSEGGWRLKELEVLLEMTRSAENNTVIPASAMDRLAISLPGRAATAARYDSVA